MRRIRPFISREFNLPGRCLPFFVSCLFLSEAAELLRQTLFTRSRRVLLGEKSVKSRKSDEYFSTRFSLGARSAVYRLTCGRNARCSLSTVTDTGRFLRAATPRVDAFLVPRHPKPPHNPLIKYHFVTDNVKHLKVSLLWFLRDKLDQHFSRKPLKYRVSLSKVPRLQ